MANVTMDIPDDLLQALRNGSRDVSRELRIAAAFFLCSRGELSTSQAARLAGMTYAGFLEAAAHAKVELFPVALAELKEEIVNGFTLGRQRVAWLQIVDPGPIPPQVLSANLGAGESAVLTHALENPGSGAIIDDSAARNAAAALGIPHQGTLGLIIFAKKQACWQRLATSLSNFARKACTCRTRS